MDGILECARRREVVSFQFSQISQSRFQLFAEFRLRLIRDGDPRIQFLLREHNGAAYALDAFTQQQALLFANLVFEFVDVEFKLTLQNGFRRRATSQLGQGEITKYLIIVLGRVESFSSVATLRFAGFMLLL